MKRIIAAGIFATLLLAAVALWAWAEDGQPAPETQPEPIVSSNGLELVDWYTTQGHELHILVRDLGYTKGNRRGTVAYSITADNGASSTGEKRFNCSPNDTYNRDITLLRYRPKTADQNARVELTVTDNKGTSEFWFDVYLK